MCYHRSTKLRLRCVHFEIEQRIKVMHSSLLVDQNSIQLREALCGFIIEA